MEEVQTPTPHIIFINNVYIVYINNYHIYNSRSFSNAFSYLCYSFFIFNLTYPDNLKKIFIYIEKYIFKYNVKENISYSIKKFEKLLK